MSVDKFGRYSSGQSSAMTPGASARYVNNNFLRRDGSNDVQGELNMNNHKLVGLTEPTESQDAATRGYIKNFTRNNFLKLDGTNNMAGDLDLNNNKITNVASPKDDNDAINLVFLESTTYHLLRRDGVDGMSEDLNMDNNKIVNLSEPTGVRDATTKRYVDTHHRKPLIAIWAQENGPLNSGEHEWSFGSGDLYTHANCGFCMPASGRIIRGSLSSVGESGGTAGHVMVRIVKNGRVVGSAIAKIAAQYSTTRTFTTNIELAKNDRINFKTGFNTPDAVNTIASLLIELDL